MPRRYTPLPSSEPLTHALPMETHPAPDRDAERLVTIVVRGPSGGTDLVGKMARQMPHERRYLSPQEYELRFGASAADIEKTERFARDHALEVVSVSAADRCVVARGSLKALGRAFRVEFVRHYFSTGYHLSHRGPIHLPEEHLPLIEAVLGLDELPIAEPHLFSRPHPVAPHVEAAAVARHYQFPEATGRGQTIAVLELGGGYHEEDIRAYLGSCGSRASVSVAYGENAPADREVLDRAFAAMGLAPPSRSSRTGDATDDMAPRNTIEATIDIELLGAFAPESEIRAYFTANTIQGKFHALAAVMRDNPDVLSMSFGGAESRKSPSHIQVTERLLRRAALQGITVVVSSGDDGQLQYPASSPHVLACGGTHLHDMSGRLVAESAWSEDAMMVEGRRLCSGGGVSGIFPRPAWQESALVEKKTGVSGRGVPDVSAKADLMTGYRTTVGQMNICMGGTSSAAPLWAGLLALLNQEIGLRVGYLTPLLYVDSALREALNPVDEGHAGMYRACPDWDPVTGLGTPRGRKLVEWFKARRDEASA